MPSLDRQLTSDETVLWRTPTYWRTIFSLLPGGVFFMAVGLAMEFYAGDRAFIPGPVFWLGFFWTAFVASYPLGAWSEVMLTDRRLVFLRRFRRPAVQVVARQDIASLEIFEGSMMLVVHGHDRERHRAFVAFELLSLARAMDIATTRWRIPEYPDSIRRIWWGMALSFAFLTMSGTVVLVLVMLEAVFSAARSGFPPFLYEVAATVIILSAAAPAALIAFLLVGWIRRLLLGHEAFALYRCHSFSAGFSGEHPSDMNEPGFWGMVRKVRLAIDRLMNGPLPECPPIEPERYEPGAFPPPGEEEEATASS